MFSGTDDLEEALSLVCVTALGLNRKVNSRMSLAECAQRLGSDEGVRALHLLADRVGVDRARFPDGPALRQLFADEAVSMKALRLHRGRNVYGGGKVALWKAVWEPLRAALSPAGEVLELARRLVAMDTTTMGRDLSACVAFLTQQLRSAAFDVDRVEVAGANPILIARRGARGLAGRIILYSHYDVAASPAADWRSPPRELIERDGRLHGLGAGDNKVALAARLHFLSSVEHTPELLWIIQGDEETGSAAAQRIMPDLLRGLTATLWLEENGYHDHDGTQRILARVIGSGSTMNLPPDRHLWRLIEHLGASGAAFGVKHRVESRGLNKDFFAAGCPFNRNLPIGARYLAIGVNDPATGIHQPNESVPSWTLPLHARQLGDILTWTDETAREDV